MPEKPKPIYEVVPTLEVVLGISTGKELPFVILPEDKYDKDDPEEIHVFIAKSGMSVTIYKRALAWMEESIGSLRREIKNPLDTMASTPTPTE